MISITEVALKPVPVKVRSGAVVAAAATLVGATVVITGNGFTIEYAKTLDVPPFGGEGGGAGPQGGPGAGPQDGPHAGQHPGHDDKVVDADFEEVDEKKRGQA